MVLLVLRRQRGAQLASGNVLQRGRGAHAPSLCPPRLVQQLRQPLRALSLLLLLELQVGQSGVTLAAAGRLDRLLLAAAAAASLQPSRWQLLHWGEALLGAVLSHCWQAGCAGKGTVAARPVQAH
jgi:hypothetical protein